MKINTQTILTTAALTVLLALAQASGSLLQAKGSTRLDSVCRDQVSIAEDFSFPQAGEYDYGLDVSDITVNTPNPVAGQPLVICATVHNHGLCFASSAWG